MSAAAVGVVASHACCICAAVGLVVAAGVKEACISGHTQHISAVWLSWSAGQVCCSDRCTPQQQQDIKLDMHAPLQPLLGHKEAGRPHGSTVLRKTELWWTRDQEAKAIC